MTSLSVILIDARAVTDMDDVAPSAHVNTARSAVQSTFFAGDTFAVFLEKPMDPFDQHRRPERRREIRIDVRLRVIEGWHRLRTPDDPEILVASVWIDRVEACLQHGAGGDASRLRANGEEVVKHLSFRTGTVVQHVDVSVVRTVGLEIELPAVSEYGPRR